MASRQWIGSTTAGMGGAVLVVLAALLWNYGSNGGLIRALGGPSAEDHPGGRHTANGEADSGKNGFSASCDYRVHLLIPPEKAKKISIDLSRYAGDSSFIYPTIVNDHFMQALILGSGESIAVEISGADGGDCGFGQASLSDLPKMCFDTKVEQRC